MKLLIYYIAEIPIDGKNEFEDNRVVPNIQIKNKLMDLIPNFIVWPEE